MFLVCSFICAVFLCLSIIFFKSYYFWGLLFSGFKENWSSSLKKVEFFLPFGFCPANVGPVVCVSFIEGEICAEFLFFCLFFLWWARLSKVVTQNANDWICIFVAGSCIQVVSFLWGLTIWYSLGLVLWQSRVLESVLPFSRLRAWSLLRSCGHESKCGAVSVHTWL